MRFLTPLVCLLALGCSDGGLTKYNSDPDAKILSPSDGDVVEAEVVQNLRGHGWANYACSRSDMPSVDTGIPTFYVSTIRELMWVR